MTAPPPTDRRLREGVIVNVVRPRDGGQLLYMRRVLGRYRDEWWPVAGKADPGETPLQAALRELHEETALQALRLYRLDRPIPNSDPGYRLHGFVALVDAQAQVRLNEEHDAHRWLDIAQALELMPSSIHPFLNDLARRFVWCEPDQRLLCWQAGREVNAVAAGPAGQAIGPCR